MATVLPDVDLAKDVAIRAIDEAARTFRETNRTIWDYAEPSLQEHRSAELLARLLESHGFVVQRGVAGLPTAFVATWGAGEPLIGVMAEYDALPGLSQRATPERQPLVPGGYGHGCGHSVFGTASAFAAIAAKEAAERAGLAGRIRCYGCPAEEIGVGKPFMLRGGVFDGADAALAWHPQDRTGADFHSLKACASVRFTFHGRASHASAAPHRGRSALDAVELLNVGVNYMREHVKDDARIHYVVTNGGQQPNVVPPEASVWYYVRANLHRDVAEYLDWVLKIAEGAALMTQTTMEHRIDSDTHEVVPNLVLARAIHRNLRRVGPPPFDDADRAFAAKVRESLPDAPPGPPLSEQIEPVTEEPRLVPASSDVGDVSWHLPLGHLSAATHAFGAPVHTWQVTACIGTPIGEKGGMVAAKALACTVVDLLADPALLQSARDEWQRRSGTQPYRQLTPADQGPPLPKG